MKEYYTRTEIQGLFDPPVSKHYLRTMQINGRMPKPMEKRTKEGWVYEKKQIDKWLSGGVEKEKCGRKEGGKQSRMSKADFDVWNIREKKEVIQYSDEVSMIIRFLRQGLLNRDIGNALGS